MVVSGPPAGAPSVAARLQQAINAHDLEAVVALFAEDYRNETPAHPARGFSGAEQVRRNWTRILGSAPDLRADLVRSTTDGDVEWSEWSWAGTGLDGRPLQMAGVVVLGIVRGRAQWARFYLEPVDRGSDGVGAAVGRFVHEGSPEDRR